MTFYVEFYADQAFLSFVKKHIAKDTKFDLEDGAVCVMACAAAIEAIVNQLFISCSDIKHYDSFRLKEKIETLGDIAKMKIDWGKEPWQGINKLIKVRNWLAHYKETTIGLVNSDSQWVTDEVNKKPKIDPGTVLSRQYVTDFYKSVLLSANSIVQELNTGAEFSFLETEEYESVIIG